MAMTGHKSVASLSVYQKVSESEKVEMGSSLAKYVVQKQSNENQLVKTTANINNNNHNNFADLQLDEWNFDIDYFPTKNPLPVASSTSSSSNVPNQIPNLPSGFFHSCNINNLHIHFPK